MTENAENHQLFAVISAFQKRVQFTFLTKSVFGSIVVSIPACHAGDRGSIPRRRVIATIVMIRRIFWYVCRACVVYFVLILDCVLTRMMKTSIKFWTVL